MQTVLVGFQCDPALKAEIVAAASPLTVSQYLRSALVEKLRRDGFRVSVALAEAPSRLGKGGPKKGGNRRAEESTLRTADSPAVPLVKITDANYATIAHAERVAKAIRAAHSRGEQKHRDVPAAEINSNVAAELEIRRQAKARRAAVDRENAPKKRTGHTP